MDEASEGQAKLTEQERLIDAPKQPFMAIRDEYLAICNGDACAAALLNHFERFSLWKKSQGWNDWEWVYIDQKALPSILLDIWPLSTIKASLMWLREGDEAKGKRIGGVGFLQTRKKEANGWDKHLEYRFDVETVQAAVCEWLSATSGTVVDNLSKSSYQPLEELGTTSRTIDDNLSESSEQPSEELAATPRKVEVNPQYLESFLEFVFRYLSEITFSSSSSESNAGALVRETAPQAAENADDDDEIQQFSPENESFVSEGQGGAEQDEPLPSPFVPLPVPAAASAIAPADADAWSAAFHQLEMQLDRASFETWLRGAELLGVVDGVFVIGVKNKYARDMLQHRLYRNVRRVLTDCRGVATELRFEVNAPKPLITVAAEPEEIPLFKLIAQQDTDNPTSPLHEAIFGAQAHDDDDPAPDKNAYEFYAQEIEPITQLIRDRLVNAVKDFGEAKVKQAIAKAALYNARKWSYVAACLEGKQNPRSRYSSSARSYARPTA